MSVEEFFSECKAGEVNAGVKQLVAKLGPNCKKSNGFTGLMYMVSVSKTPSPLFHYLLSLPDVDVNHVSSKGLTVLHYAAFYNRVGAVRALVNREDTDMAVKNKKGQTAKEFAAARGHKECASIIGEAEGGRVEARNPTKEESLLDLATGVASMANSDEFADLTLQCDGQEFKCHKIVVAARSAVLKSALTSHMFVEKNNSKIIIDDCTPEAVKGIECSSTFTLERFPTT